MTPKDTSTSWSGIDWETLPHGGDLFGEFDYAERKAGAAPAKPSLWPGLMLCGMAAASAAWLSEHYGFPIMLLGLLVGLSLNFITRDPATHRGLDFASTTCLRVGIVLLGLQVSVAQVSALGATPFAALLAVMAVAILAGIAGARLVGQSRHAGVLAGGSTAICGASAALALLIGASGRFRKAGTDVRPWQPTTAIVVTGPYRWTRNPMYLGMAWLYVAAALWADSWLPIFLLWPLLETLKHGVILREERYLRDKFGDEYIRYQERVRRWW